MVLSKCIKYNQILGSFGEYFSPFCSKTELFWDIIFVEMG